MTTETQSQIASNITGTVQDQIFDLLAPANKPALIWAGFSLVIALMLGFWARTYFKALPQNAATAKNPGLTTRWYGRLLPLLAPVAYIILLAIGITIVKKEGLDDDLAQILTDSALVWFLIAAVYVTTHSVGKTIFAALVIIPYAVLSVFGILEDVVKFLSDISFILGKLDISLYHIVRFVVSVVLLVWVSNACIKGIEYSLQHMKHMRANTRQLFTTLSRVCIYVIAGLVALSTLGIDLTALAIFSGALGVGLGFGLQKIASNFVSGLILLLERSVEVNDLIEIPNADILGLVRYTSARYTLVETFDNREVMIPNEDFISQRVINWTFSSPRGLLRIPIIVSYNSNIEKARDLMLEAAKEHPRCLQEPAPSCLLQKFDDFAVNFMLLVWIGDIREKRLTTQSEIMFAIWKKFAENGIGIPRQVRETELPRFDAAPPKTV